MPAVSESSLLPIRPNLGRAFGGIWRLTWGRFRTTGQLMLLLGMGTLLILLSLVRIRNGQEEDFIPWTADFYLGFIVPVMAFLAGAAAISDEMKSSTTDYVLTRPVGRLNLVIFKFFSHLVCIQLFDLIVLGALLGLAMSIHIPDVLSAAPRLLLAQALALTGFSSLGFLFAAITSRYLVLGIIYAGTVEIAVGHIPTQLNHLSMSHQLSALLQPIGAEAIGFMASTTSEFTIAALLLSYSAAFVALCALVYSRREMVGTGRSS
jgi:ABC-type transport system involved in multi-copper enzyme maturation permease subunit